MDQCLTVYTLIKGLLLLLVNKLRVSITLVFQSVANLQLLNLLAKVKQSIKPYHAQLTNQVLLIKVGLMNVLHSLGQVGQQLLTTVRQILQRVYQALKRGR
jgi:hypothetical protein